MAAPALAGAACFADVAPRVDRLGCPPAGIAAVPLVREAGDEWPKRVDVSVGGLNSTAPVVWVGARPDDGARPWTRSPEQYEVRPIESFPAGSEPESVGDVLARRSRLLFLDAAEAARAAPAVARILEQELGREVDVAPFEALALQYRTLP